MEKKLEEIRLKTRRKESTVIDFEIIKKGFEGFYKVYPSLEPKERQALARLFIKEVKVFNDKVDVEFLEFPELAHQDPVQILKEPSIRGGKSNQIKDYRCLMNSTKSFSCERTWYMGESLNSFI